jgi:hypothetical protein
VKLSRNPQKEEEESMGKLSNPVRFSTHFGIEPAYLEEVGALDPTLNLDTNLFIDPLLLQTSQHAEIREQGYQGYCKHFEKVITLLKHSQNNNDNDTYWRNARKLMSFPEIKHSCLGYGANSVSGSGSGSSMTDFVMQTAKDIVALGITDPDMFVAMSIFEEGIGPDRISDMATNVIIDALVQFTERVLAPLSIPQQRCTIISGSKSISANLPINPFVKGNNTGILLVPTDILKALPIAKDWESISYAASRNNTLRHEINQQISGIWERKTLKDKHELKRWALQDKQAFESLLGLIKATDKIPYDVKKDPKGEIFWRSILERIAEVEPFIISKPECLDFENVQQITEKIIEQFRFLVEDRRLSEELYVEGRPRPEKSAQRLFFAVAHAYCKANNIDLTPEADTGNGPVDFKLSQGYTGRVLVEIKLSTNTKVKSGYTRQLETYANAEEAIASYYLVIDVGNMGKKREELNKIHTQRIQSRQNVKHLRFIDGLRRPSASNL